MHWHQEVELLYPLNGEADVTVGGRTYHLKERNILVVEENQLHSVHNRQRALMFLCIHISKEKLKQYVPLIQNRLIELVPETVTDDKLSHYQGLCNLLDELTRCYMVSGEMFTMEADGIVLQVTAGLLKFFSREEMGIQTTDNIYLAERIRAVIDFVSEHYREPLTLADGAQVLGLGREYFARFFKKATNLSFLQYVNEVRLSHVYFELLHTDRSVSEIMEENGFTNQKFFNSLFKRYYGMTPSVARKHPEKQEFLMNIKADEKIVK